MTGIKSIPFLLFSSTSNLTYVQRLTLELTPSGVQPNYQPLQSPPTSSLMPIPQGMDSGHSTQKGPNEIGTQLIDALRKHDEDKIKNCNSDIDTLLVFAGLFSAIISAFLIESYKLLQQDPTDLSAQLLVRISVQLASSTGSSSAIAPVTEIPQFTVPASAIRVNALWFAGLLCSLVTASLAMFVKQWLREYLAWGCSSTEERIRVRHVRYEGLIRWKVFEIAAMLPLLLQTALWLFLVGLSEFLRAIHHTVWLSTTILAIIWLSTYAMSVLAPAFSSNCPYKTPLSMRFMQQLRLLMAQIRYGASWRERTGFNKDYYHFPGDERGIRRDNNLDVRAIISADKTLADDNILVDAIQECIEIVDGPKTLTIVREILQHRLDTRINFPSNAIPFDRIPIRVLEAVVMVLSGAIRREVASLNAQWSPWLEGAITGLASLMNHVRSNRRAVNVMEGVDAISGTFALSRPIVGSVLRILATDSPLLSSWSLQGPPSTYPAAMTIISATREVLSPITSTSRRVEPLRLLGEVLAIMSGMPDYCLRMCAGELSNLTREFSKIISASGQNFVISPERGSLATYSNHLLLMCESLNQRAPKSINMDLIGFLTLKSGSQQSAPHLQGVLPFQTNVERRIFGPPTRTEEPPHP